LEQRAPTLGKLDPLTKLERMIVGDDDLRATNFLKQIAWHQFPTSVITVRVIRVEDPQSFLNRETRCYDKKPTAELLAVGATFGIDRLPGDEHRHDGRLARAGGELERESHQFGIGVMVGIGEVFKKTFASFRVRGNLRQPDRCLCRFDLTEEWSGTAEWVMPPVVEQSRCFRCNLPVILIG
jgi:hypothetical protein